MLKRRCDTTQFKLSRSQKKAIKRVNKFLAFGTKGVLRTGQETQIVEMMEEQCVNEPKLDISDTVIKPNLVAAGPSSSSNTALPVAKNATSRRQQVSLPAKERSELEPKKAKHIRIERKVQKLMKKLNCDEAKAQSAMKHEHMNKLKKLDKNLDSWLAGIECDQPAHRLEVYSRTVLNSC